MTFTNSLDTAKSIDTHLGGDATNLMTDPVLGPLIDTHLGGASQNLVLESVLGPLIDRHLATVRFTATRSATSIILPLSSFVSYPLDVIATNIGGGSYNVSTFVYTVPVAGLYLCTGAIRITDNQAVRSVALGIGISNADAPSVLWDDMGILRSDGRSGRQYTRLATFAAGDQVRMFIYSGGITFPTNPAGVGQQMSLILLH